MEIGTFLADNRPMQKAGLSKITRFGKCIVAGTVLLFHADWAARAAVPYAATQPPTEIAPTAAVLNGMATARDSAATAWFEWGSSGSFGQATTPVNVDTSDGVARVSCALSNLTVGGV